MARSKTYQMLMKISGDSSSLKKACEAASEHLDTLGNAAKAAGKVAATALAGIGTAAAGIAVAATSVYTEHEKAASWAFRRMECFSFCNPAQTAPRGTWTKWATR